MRIVAPVVRADDGATWYLVARPAFVDDVVITEFDALAPDRRSMMARSRIHHSLGYRAEQTGLLLATGSGPLTFQRTLMPRVDERSGDDHRLVVRGESRGGERAAGVAPIGRAPVHGRGRPRRGRRTHGGAAPRLRSTPPRSRPGSACNGRSRLAAASGCLAPARALEASCSRPRGSAACSSVACRNCSIVGALGVGRRSSSSCLRRPVSPSAARCSGDGERVPTSATPTEGELSVDQVAGHEPRGHGRHDCRCPQVSAGSPTASRAPQAASCPATNRCGARSVTSCRSRRSLRARASRCNAASG